MKKNPLKQKKSDNFNFATARSYIFATLIAFHIAPLVLMAMKMNMLVAMTMMCMTVYPSFVAILSFIYGLKIGFSWKYPLFVAVIFAPSLLMYYMPLTTPDEIMHALLATMIYTIVYAVFSFIATICGGYLKRYIKQ